MLDFDDDDNDSLLVLSESDTNNTILATTTSPTNTVTDDGEGDHLNLLEEDTSFGNIDFYGEEDGEEEDDDLQTGDEIYQETDGEEEEGRYEDEIEFPQGPLDATTLHHHHHPRQLFIEQTSTIGYPNSISNSNNNSKRNNISILPSFAAKYMEVEEWRSNLTILSPPSSSSVLLATDTIASG